MKVDKIRFNQNNWLALANDLHEFNVAKGWWDDYPNKKARYETAMMLTLTELAEATEGLRKDLMDDKLPQYKMFHVEVADAMIRLLDLFAAFETEFSICTGKIANYWERELTARSPVEQLWFVVCNATKRSSKLLTMTVMFEGLLGMVYLHEIPIMEIIEAKMYFNAERADHKRENRAKKGGKSF